MLTRTTEKTVIFTRPFVLGELDEVLPAGAHTVETDEELLLGISFPAYRRVMTLIHLHPNLGQPGLTRTLTVDPNELDAAIKREQETEETPAATDTGPGTLEMTTASRSAEVDRRAMDRAENEGMIDHRG